MKLYNDLTAAKRAFVLEAAAKHAVARSLEALLNMMDKLKVFFVYVDEAFFFQTPGQIKLNSEFAKTAKESLNTL